MPTQGFNIKSLVHDGFKLNVWDVGGEKLQFRSRLTGKGLCVCARHTTCRDIAPLFSRLIVCLALRGTQPQKGCGRCGGW